MTDNNEGVWKTIRGRKVLIQEGETATDAINRSIAEHNEDLKEKQIKQNKEQADKLNNKGKTDVSEFEDGDTPKVLSDAATYHILKEEGKGTSDLGNVQGSDAKSMLKGFKFNGLFWENPSVKYIYEVRNKK